MQNVIVKREGETLLAYITCELDHHTAKDVRERIDGALDSPPTRELVLDFSGVSFMDSSGIGLILGRLECCERHSVRLRVRGHTGLVARLIAMSGVARLRNITVE